MNYDNNAIAVDPDQALDDRNQMIHFFKNMMIVGGLVQIVHFGPGRLSWDYCSNKEEGV